MSTRTDDLIEQLAREARPRFAAAGPLASTAAWTLLAGALVVVWGAAKLGLRPDAATTLPTVHWLAVVVGCVALAAVAAAFALTLSRPGRVVGARTRALLAASLITVGVGVGAYAALPDRGFAAGIDLAGIGCSIGVAMLAFIPALALFAMTRRLAPMAPMPIGAAIGLAAGAIAQVGLALHCPSDNVVHIVVYHGLPVLLLATVGGIVGARLLKW